MSVDTDWFDQSYPPSVLNPDPGPDPDPDNPPIAAVNLGQTVVDGEYVLGGDGVRALPVDADGNAIDVDRVTAVDWGNGATNFDPAGGYIAYEYHEAQTGVQITVTLDDGSSATSEPFDVVEATVQGEAPFDPSCHTVAEVEAYIAAHPDEADYVVTAERAGKNRTSITGG